MHYFAFGGRYYYPGGGARDFIANCGTVQEAMDCVEREEVQWGHIAEWDGGDELKIVRYYSTTGPNNEDVLGHWLGEEAA